MLRYIRATLVQHAHSCVFRLYRAIGWRPGVLTTYLRKYKDLNFDLLKLSSGFLSIPSVGWASRVRPIHCVSPPVSQAEVDIQWGAESKKSNTPSSFVHGRARCMLTVIALEAADPENPGCTRQGLSAPKRVWDAGSTFGQIVTFQNEAPRSLRQNVISPGVPIGNVKKRTLAQGIPTSKYVWRLDPHPIYRDVWVKTPGLKAVPLSHLCGGNVGYQSNLLLRLIAVIGSAPLRWGLRTDTLADSSQSRTSAHAHKQAWGLSEKPVVPTQTVKMQTGVPLSTKGHNGFMGLTWSDPRQIATRAYRMAREGVIKDIARTQDFVEAFALREICCDFQRPYSTRK
ncbi:hypothetical protein F5148DRAFT_1148534 [Russula earlei]|uniref:Uncharacterized protein n=1 Tax=Russula earlei TaxID=71964 RepID=A0ACC0UBX3_9AGAM|nr:hypothetical protein F5148DRAFT_1148534 [Russula earlei]